MTENTINQSVALLITQDGMGSATIELQQKLMGVYLRLLVESETLPAAICFYTDGVKLVVEGSPVLEQLKSLEAKGVHLVICRTCLEYFGLEERVQVGVIGGMTDIIEAQWRASKVITL
ncbi:MAG: DsrE family protein [Anaerolineae bacterium]|nr:DsrE family protein [Anaerolineae bacterium]